MPFLFNRVTSLFASLQTSAIVRKFSRTRSPSEDSNPDARCDVAPATTGAEQKNKSRKRTTVHSQLEPDTQLSASKKTRRGPTSPPASGRSESIPDWGPSRPTKPQHLKQCIPTLKRERRPQLPGKRNASRSVSSPQQARSLSNPCLNNRPGSQNLKRSAPGPEQEPDLQNTGLKKVCRKTGAIEPVAVSQAPLTTNLRTSQAVQLRQSNSDVERESAPQQPRLVNSRMGLRTPRQLNIASVSASKRIYSAALLRKSVPVKNRIPPPRKIDFDGPPPPMPGVPEDYFSPGARGSFHAGTRSSLEYIFDAPARSKAVAEFTFNTADPIRADKVPHPDLAPVVKKQEREGVVGGSSTKGVPLDQQPKDAGPDGDDRPFYADWGVENPGFKERMRSTRRGWLRERKRPHESDGYQLVLRRFRWTFAEEHSIPHGSLYSPF